LALLYTVVALFLRTDAVNHFWQTYVAGYDPSLGHECRVNRPACEVEFARLWKEALHDGLGDAMSATSIALKDLKTLESFDKEVMAVSCIERMSQHLRILQADVGWPWATFEVSWCLNTDDLLCPHLSVAVSEGRRQQRLSSMLRYRDHGIEGLKNG
jgi:hypothetical protein